MSLPIVFSFSGVLEVLHGEKSLKIKHSAINPPTGAVNQDNSIVLATPKVAFGGHIVEARVVTEAVGPFAPDGTADHFDNYIYVELSHRVVEGAQISVLVCNKSDGGA